MMTDDDDDDGGGGDGEESVMTSCCVMLTILWRHWSAGGCEKWAWSADEVVEKEGLVQ